MHYVTRMYLGRTRPGTGHNITDAAYAKRREALDNAILYAAGVRDHA